MPMDAREEPFAAFVDAYRHRLVGTAALVHLDPHRAGAVVDSALAQTYARWTRLDDPYGFALRAVLDPGRGPRASATAFELVDVARSEPATGDISTELASLSVDERRTLVLAAYTGLPIARIAEISGRSPEDVRDRIAAAEQRLRGTADPGEPRRLGAELSAAAELAASVDPPGASPNSDPDLRRSGRAVLRRRRLRLVAVVSAAVLLVAASAVGIRQLLPPPTPIAATAPSGTPSGPACDPSSRRCRAAALATWRQQMAEVISEHLDPGGHYFTATSYSFAGDPYVGFWAGTGGALDLGLHRARGGATEVYLQIATSRRDAIRCGQLTNRRCQGQRFMDGNRYLLTDPFDVAHGLEVQYRPEGSYVITVVARNTSRTGRELPVTRGDLITLAGDPRLRLPAR